MSKAQIINSSSSSEASEDLSSEELLVILPHENAHILENLPETYWNYEDEANVHLTWGDQSKYEIIRKLGRGKYSEVYEAINMENQERVVLKILKPVMPRKLYREVMILRLLRGGPNIIQMLDMVKDPSSNSPCLIFELVNNVDFRTLYPTLTDMDVRYYMYQLLLALQFANSKGIMHRDIKPHNIMINHTERTLRLIDWGLAEFYHPSKDYSVKAASRHYKGPELLLGYTTYDYSLDMWGVGCVLAEIIFMQHPFFRGDSDHAVLTSISRYLGTDLLEDYVNKYGIDYEGPQMKYHAGKPFESLVSEANKHLAHPDAINLLKRLLLYDHNNRLWPTKALEHPYFDPVRSLPSSCSSKSSKS